MIDGQLGLYEEQVEAWQVDHSRAMNCLDLEAVIGLGLHIYRTIRRADDQWSKLAGRCGSQLRDDDADQLSKWYIEWLKPCDALLKEIKVLTAQGKM